MSFDGPVPGIPDATIRRVESLPAHLPGAEPAGQFAHAKPGQLLLDVPHIARFLVRGGTSIDVSVEPDADAGVVMLLLNGSARGALIHQRGELPLHAATLVPPGRDWALAICGVSGAGKSTLAVELSRRGWILVADDTTRVTWKETQALAWPSRDSIKLRLDACRANNLEVAGLERVTMNSDKYYVHVPARDEPVRLAAVIELTFDSPAPGPRPALSPGERLSVLARHTYRQSYIRPLGRQADFARVTAQLAGACHIRQLLGARVRPSTELADAVVEICAGLL